jgi:creatinine amidohydrolase/Fe(II)-dependent formamide hydrolase-like protein
MPVARLVDVCRGKTPHGSRPIDLLTCHGRNTFLESVVDQLQARLTDFEIAMLV